MKTLSIILFALSLSFSVNAQKESSFYGAFSVGFVPYNYKGYFDLNLTIGSKISKHGFAEYNMIRACTSLSTVPSFFQLRGGYSFKVARNEDLRVFVGSGVRPAYYNEVGRVKGCVTYGFYLFQKVDNDFYMKYEVAMTGIKLMPTIGFGSKF